MKKTIYFEKGRPCFAISNLVTDRFGPFLVRVGKISPPQLELCQAAADKTGRRTGDVLGEMGLLKETEKLYYVAQQVKAIVYSVFGWEEGEYRMHFTDRAATEAIKIDLHPANLITRGVKKLYKPERLYRLLSAGGPARPVAAARLRARRGGARALGGGAPARGWTARAPSPSSSSSRSGRSTSCTAFLVGLVALKLLERDPDAAPGARAVGAPARPPPRPRAP